MKTYIKVITILCVCLVHISTVNSLAAQQEADDPNKKLNAVGYQTVSIEGWTVLISETLAEQKPAKTQRALALLTKQLKTVKTVLPDSAFKKLHHVPIWFSPVYPGARPTGEYHPGKRWLIQNKRDPKLAKCIEFTNIEIFEREIKRMPMVVLHELAHAYHDQVLGFNNDRIEKEFKRAVNEGIYNSVYRPITNRKEKAYAMSNAREYFAETTEAFFGQNDFYPLTNDQLERHDPKMHALLKELWGVE